MLKNSCFFYFFIQIQLKFLITQIFLIMWKCQFMPICKIKFDQHRVKNIIISWSIKLTTALSSTVEFCAKSFHNDCSVYVYCLLSIVNCLCLCLLSIVLSIDNKHRRLTGEFFTKMAIFFVSAATLHVGDYQKQNRKI